MFFIRNLYSPKTLLIKELIIKVMAANTNLEQAFINQLTEIIKVNLKNEQFGVSELAKEMKISRSSLYIKVKTITKKSVSRFISEIRLNKAMELLLQSNRTVSEVSYEVGFGSPTYFNKCFHDYFGFPPGEVDKKILLQNPGANAQLQEQDNNIVKKQSKKMISIAAIAFIVLVSILFIWVKPFSSPKAPMEKSIAILPLKNTVADSETQILADGILEDILNRLSHIQELTVKSRNSSDVFRNSTKTSPQIASELGVSYLLEGTILKEGENIRIYIQLIDAVNDKHVWSAQYSKDLLGIFKFITDVSAQIASELEIVLTESEKNQIRKIYTKNTEAYKLYQKGRFFWHRRSEQGLKTGIEYFNQALELDPEYSLAWAGLADSYLILTFWGWYPWDDGFLKSREYALEAIRLDNHLAEPHVTLGSMELYYNHNWKFAEKEFLKSIEINPNYSNAYLFYADYLSMLGKYEEARINLDKAIELFPNALINYHTSSSMYLDIGKFDEALKESDKLLEIDKNFKPSYWIRFKIFYYKGEELKAIDAIQKILSLDSPNENHLDELKQMYAETGMDGVIYWLIEYLENQQNKGPVYHNNHITIARLYGLLGDRESVLKHLTQGLKQGKTSATCYVYTDYEFKFLHDDPEFIAFLNLTNIPLD